MRQYKDLNYDLYLQSGSLAEYLFRKKLASDRKLCRDDPDYREKYLDDNRIKPSVSSGFKVRRYKSGEMTGAFFTAGLPSKDFGGGGRPAVTCQLTRSALQKIRRSVENSETFLKYFCTLTFAPACLYPWHFNVDGTVKHDFAKWKLKKFLDAAYRRQRRLNRELSFVWVAELQKNGNIHFHILFDQFFPIHWLSKIWGQAENSVDIQKVNNSLHAARYMRKYITKDADSPIQGHRYYISEKLRESMMPQENILIRVNEHSSSESREKLDQVRDYMKMFSEDIKADGGFVISHGFNIPAARQSTSYRCKKTGNIKKTSYVSPKLAKVVYANLHELTYDLPF